MITNFIPWSIRIGLTLASLPQTGTVTELSVSDAVSKALANKEFAQIQLMIRDRAEAQVGLARTQLGPQFFVAGHGSLGANSSLGLSDVLLQRDRIGVQGSLQLYDGGKALAEYHESKSNRDAAVANLSEERISLQEQVANFFFAALRAEEHVKVSVQLKAAADAHLVDAKARFELGDATKGEVIAAQSLVSQADSNLIADQSVAFDNETRLARLMDEDPTKIRMKPKMPSDAKSPVEEVDALYERAIAISPSLKKLQADEAAERYHLTSVKAGYGLAFKAVAGTGYLGYSNPFASSASPSRVFAFVGVQGLMPIFNGKALEEAVRAEKDTLNLRRLAIEKLKKDLRVDVQIDVEDAHSAIRSLQAGEESLGAAKEAFRLAKERYAIGRGTQTDVLRALSNLSVAAYTVADAQIQCHQVKFKIATLTGGALP